jgi:hypothetical protein
MLHGITAGFAGFRFMQKIIVRIGVSTLASFWLAGAAATEAPMLDGFAVDFGLYANSFDADLRASGSGNRGTDINLKHDLGLDDSRSLPYLDMTWRPFERHEFLFSYYSDDVSNSRTLARDITIRGNTYTAGASLSSKFEYDSYGVGYRYWAWIGDEAAFGLNVGLQAYSFDLKLRGTVSVESPGGGASTVDDFETKASTSIPDPYIGVSYRYQMIDWARFVADAGAFKANVGDVDATLYNARLGIEFYPWQNFGIVTQYSYNKIDADISKGSFDGNATFRFSGAQVLARLRF